MNNLSNLNKTWIFDLDGTLVKHNGYKEKEEPLNGVKEFFDKNVKEEDFVIILTAREKKYLKSAKNLLELNNIKVDLYVSSLPHGERLLFNDKKNDGLKTSYCFNLERNEGFENFLK